MTPSIHEVAMHLYVADCDRLESKCSVAVTDEGYRNIAENAYKKAHIFMDVAVCYNLSQGVSLNGTLFK